MAIRSFLAFELPSSIRKTVEEVLDEVKQYDLGVRWVPPANIHLTIIFLGGINEEDIPGMGMRIEKTCSQTAAFDISLQGMGCFPNNRNPRVLWLGLEGDLERMSIFRDELQDQLLVFGLKQEKRPFRPHLTLGRFKKPDKKNIPRLEKILEDYHDLASPARTLSELVQFQSHLKPTGAIYTRMASWKLKAPAD